MKKKKSFFAGVYNGESLWIHVNCDSDVCPKLALKQTSSAANQANVDGRALDAPRGESAPWPTNCYLSFGRRCGGGNTWNGFLVTVFFFIKFFSMLAQDDFILFNEALTPTQVNTLRKERRNAIQPVAATAIVHFPFDEDFKDVSCTSIVHFSLLFLVGFWSFNWTSQKWSFHFY